VGAALGCLGSGRVAHLHGMCDFVRAVFGHVRSPGRQIGNPEATVFQKKLPMRCNTGLTYYHSLDDEPLICGVDVSGGGAAWNLMAFRRGTDARSIPRIRIPGEHTRDRSVLVGKLAEILRDQRPTGKVSAIFIDMAFGSPIYERLWRLRILRIGNTLFGGASGSTITQKCCKSR
jgi:hypothetical protein